MKAIIVGGGRGERLRPLTDTIPKAMIDVAGKPILEHILLHLKRHGIINIILALCYLPKKIQDYFGNGKKFGVNIAYAFELESKPMGTAGAILSAKPHLSDTFVVTYADILRKLDITDMIKNHKKEKAFATLHTYKRFGKDPKSRILFNKDKRITQFIEQPAETNESFVWANGSFYILEPEIYSYIPHNKPSDFGKDIFPDVLSDNKLVLAYPTEGYFIDIGNLEKLNTARLREGGGEKR